MYMYYNVQIRMQSFTENKEIFVDIIIQSKDKWKWLNKIAIMKIIEFLKRQAKPEWHGVFIRSLKIIIRNN